MAPRMASSMLKPNVWRKSTRSGPWSDSCIDIMWHKSSHSNHQGNCIDVGWSKSSQSVDNGNCVDVGRRKPKQSTDLSSCVEIDCQCHNGQVLMRDTKDNEVGPVLSFSVNAWRDFISAIKENELI
jgi:hypothetical protein